MLDLPQDHLRNVAGRRAKLGYGIGRIKEHNAVVFVAMEYGCGIDTQAHQNRMPYAYHELQHKGGAYLIFAHIGKRAVVHNFKKFRIVIAVVVRYGVDGNA